MGDRAARSKPHFSYSQLAMIGRCGVQYEFRYIKGLVIPPAVAQVQGSNVHKGRERALVRKMASGALPELAEVESVVADGMAQSFAGEILLDGDWADRGLAWSRAHAKDEAVELARLDYREHLPKINPVAVEQELYLEHPSLAAPLLGYLDCVTVEDDVVDLKTAGKSPSQDDVDSDLQLSCYAVLFRSKYHRLERGLRIDALVKTKVPKAVSVVTSRTDQQLQVFLNRMARALEAVRKELWLPADPGWWGCSTKFCGYSSRCPYFAGKERPKS